MIRFELPPFMSNREPIQPKRIKKEEKMHPLDWDKFRENARAKAMNPTACNEDPEAIAAGLQRPRE